MTGLAMTAVRLPGSATLAPSPAASSLQGGDFFALAQQRLEYIDQRQRMLAQNIANADTPAYRARDLAPFDQSRGATAAPALTDARHMQGSITPVSFATDTAAGRAPDGNTVDVETQLTKVADDETNAAMVGNLWKTTMGMYMTALGRG
jgi:flagellar basal-body rod protein FlgB